MASTVYETEISFAAPPGKNCPYAYDGKVMRMLRNGNYSWQPRNTFKKAKLNYQISAENYLLRTIMCTLQQDKLWLYIDGYLIRTDDRKQGLSDLIWSGIVAICRKKKILICYLKRGENM